MTFWRNGSEWVTVGLVLAGLLLAEASMRAVRSSLSLDIRHMDEMGEIVSDLHQSEGFRVLLAGNSLLRAGVDAPTLEGRLSEELATPVTVGMIYPDGSNPTEWRFLHRRLIFHPQAGPDVVVLAFGHGHLRDRPVEESLLRMAAHHVAREDVFSFVKDELTDTESRSEFLLARASTAFALRDRIAPRVLSALIPFYTQLAPILLQAPGAAEVEAAAEAAGEAAGDDPDLETDSGLTYNSLRRLLSDYEAAQIPVVALAMPSPEDFQVDAGAQEVFAEFRTPVLLISTTPRLEMERFPDGSHMDQEGMDRFTEALGPVLGALIQGSLSPTASKALK